MVYYIPGGKMANILYPYNPYTSLVNVSDKNSTDGQNDTNFLPARKELMI